jgi:ATP-dependent Clp protease, protease subunit
MSELMQPAALEGGFDPRSAVFDRLLKNRVVMLGSDVNDEIANQICAQLLYLEGEDPGQDIWLYINSPGGSVTAGMAIYDTMQFVDCDVATVCLGLAASMGQFLLTAGANGKRYTLPNARVMMHQPLAGLRGQASDIAIQAEQLRYTKLRMATLIAEHSGQTSSRSRPTPSATAGSPPRRPRSTASSTRSSCAAARSAEPIRSDRIRHGSDGGDVSSGVVSSVSCRMVGSRSRVPVGRS